MNRPSPRPRPKPADNAITEKSPAERLTGVAEKPSTPRTQITYHEATYVRAETPIGFEAATFCKTGVDLAPASEQSAVSK